MVAGFILIQPADEISRQIQLLLHLDDKDYVERYREFEDWFKHTQDIPERFYLWVVEHLFRDNALVGGSLYVRDQRVSLAKLDMPLNLLAGATDHITPPDQVFAVAALASTPPEHVVKRRHRWRSPRPVHGPSGAAGALAATDGEVLRHSKPRNRRPPRARA